MPSIETTQEEGTLISPPPITDVASITAPSPSILACRKSMSKPPQIVRILPPRKFLPVKRRLNPPRIATWLKSESVELPPPHRLIWSRQLDTFPVRGLVFGAIACQIIMPPTAIMINGQIGTRTLPEYSKA